MATVKQRVIKLETVKAEATGPQGAHVVIYDAATQQPLNGPVPEGAGVVIYIPSNGRDG